MSELITGRRAVLETLRARRRRILRLWIEGDESARSGGSLDEIRALAAELSLPVRFQRGGLFDRLQHEQANAQGVALEAGDYPSASHDDVLRHARAADEPPFLLILDHLQDPQNLGTLLRTAEAMGVHGVIIPDRRAARITAAVTNASAGAVEHLRVAQVTNLNRTIQELKERNVWVAGLDDAPNAVPLAQAKLAGALALVVGAEGEGMSRLTRESCDFLVRIPMQGVIASLNASVAGSIALYEAREARR